jgi:PIN domain nuclease of toxin-antitoxin system
VRLLLDTHIVLWWLADDGRLAGPHREAIMNGENDVFVSSVSIAEIAIKQSLGRLDAPFELLELLVENGLEELPLSSAHAQALRDLPPLHRDPFDRMLVTQAICDGLTLVTDDDAITKYDVITLERE